MNRTLKFVLALAGLLVIAVVAYYWAIGIIDSTYAYRSPIKDTPPQPAKSAFEPATRRLVFVLIDGLRVDTSLKPQVMPVLNSLRQKAASATTHSQAPSFSESGYSTLLTGAWPYLSDGPALNKDYEDIPTFTQDDLFSAVHRSGKKTGISAYYWFEKLVPQSAVDLKFYTPGDDQAADREVVNAAKPMLKDASTALVLIHIDQVDYAGHHEGGALNPNWDAAAKRSDDLLGEILALLDLQKDTIVVLSDHGHIDQGGHGGPDPVVLVQPFVLAGAGVKPGSYGEIQMVDIAPTLAVLLGANIPASSQGSVRAEMLNLPPASASALPASQRTQQEKLASTAIKAVGGSVSAEALTKAASVADFQSLINNAITARLTSERIPRALISIVLIAAAVFIFIRSRSKAKMWWLAGGLLAAALFHLRFAVLDGKPYSISGVTGQMDLILYVAVTTAICLLFGWLAAAFGSRLFKNKPFDAAENTLAFIYTSLALLMLVVLVHFTLNGALVGWMLPEMYTSFIALISLIQMLITALVGLTLVGVSALFGLRNRKA